MEVEYKTEKTRRLCRNFAYAKRQLPTEVAEKLMAHIDYIEKASSFGDIVNYPPFRFHKLLGDRKGEFALDVGRKLGFRIIIDPLGEDGISLKDEMDINVVKRSTRIVLVVEVTNHYA